MNERITKIVIDTFGKEGVVNSRVYGHWLLSDEELEKFAELIVRECQLRVEQYINECGEVASMPDTVIMKHFGVEE